MTAKGFISEYRLFFNDKKYNPGEYADTSKVYDEKLLIVEV